VQRQPEGDVMPWQVDVLTRDAAVLLFIFTLALPFLRRLEAALEHLIFRREHGVREALIELSKALPAVVKLDAVGHVLTSGLVARVPALHATLFVRDVTTGVFTLGPSAISDAAERRPVIELPDEALRTWLGMAGRAITVEESALHPHAYRAMQGTMRRLEQESVALVLPVFSETQVVAVLFLGEKASGEVYSDAEIELLETLMREAGIVMRNAGLYRDLEQQMETLRRAQEQLVQSAKLAAIGELAASVAHELNNPLMVISGRAQLLLRQVPPDSSHGHSLTLMVDEAHRASGIVRNMLDFARKRDSIVQRISLNDVIDRALALLEARLESARIDVARIFDGGLPDVAGDRDQLTQVFVNLISNAADAMPHGGVVTIETEGLSAGFDAEPETAVVAVRDIGGGIAPERLARIFEPFYTTKAEGRGTGLGLSVSLGIVRQHGGRIEVDTVAGDGTAMRVLLPGFAEPSDVRSTDVAAKTFLDRRPTHGPLGDQPNPLQAPRPAVV
jgi:signal transduction histidine kinase